MRQEEHSFFTEFEKERIRTAVETAEATTSGEIATMVVTRSDSYAEAAQFGSMMLAGLVGFILCAAFRHVSIWTYVPVIFILFFPALFLMRAFPVLQRPFIARKRAEEAVRARAIRAFYEKGLYRTRHETGILIFVSSFERKVWILGDRGINSRIPADYWKDLAAILASGLREGRACDAFCTVIERCGCELSRHFPKRDDDRNELPDELM